MARTYTMSARAQATERTRERILDSAIEAFLDLWYDDVALGRIAEAAGVSTQTVLNHFGSKEGLADAAFQRRVAATESRRFAPEAGDLPALVAALVDDYEEIGDTVLRGLALEDRVQGLRTPIARGREGHRAWCAEKLLAPPEVLPVVVAATDVYVWKLLRRDQGLERAATEAAILRLVRAVLDGGRA